MLTNNQFQFCVNICDSVHSLVFEIFWEERSGALLGGISDRMSGYNSPWRMIENYRRDNLQFGRIKTRRPSFEHLQMKSRWIARAPSSI